MERFAIQRHGTYLYAQAWQKIILALSLLWMIIGGGVAFVVVRFFHHPIIAAIIVLIALAVLIAVWVAYQSALWTFKREAQQSVIISTEGMREMSEGRERSFIPWEGVTEIELAAALPAGSSLRVRSNFSEIAFSNVDLVVTPQMSLRQMHASLAQTDPFRELLQELRQQAPQARLTLNRLAKRRMKKNDQLEWL